MLNDLKKVMDDKGIVLGFTDEAVRFVAKQSYSSKFGARNMRRYIQKNIEDEIANKIIEEYLDNISVISIDLDSENNKLSIICK